MGSNRRVVAIMALATGAVVANLYYVQPLEDTLASAFQPRPARSAWSSR